MGSLLYLLVLLATLHSVTCIAAIASATTIDELTAQLDDPDPRVRLQAIQRLRDSGPEALPALPTLIRMPAQTDNQETAYLYSFRVYLAKALGRMGIAALPALKQASEHDDVNTRIVAVRALGEMGPPAHEAVPALIELTGAEDFDLRYWSYDTLGKIGPAAAEAVPVLIEQFRSGDSGIRNLAADALAAIGTSEALQVTRSYRIRKALQKALILPFSAFMFIPGLALLVPVMLLIPYFALQKRKASRWCRSLVLIPIVVWTLYGIHECALALFWTPYVGGAPIRVDLLLLMPLLYLLLLVAFITWLWCGLKHRGKE